MRSTWDHYFMRMAREASTRATCDRKHVGAVIVRDKSVLATGYNGSIRGLPHCDDVGHLMIDNHCARTVHAEMNAIAQAARNGTSIDGSTIYVTAFPCLGCMKVLANAGIVRVVYGELYRLDPESARMAEAAGIECNSEDMPTPPASAKVSQSDRQKCTMTVKDAASILDVCESAVRQAAYARRIKSIKLGGTIYLDPESVAAYRVSRRGPKPRSSAGDGTPVAEGGSQG